MIFRTIFKNYKIVILYDDHRYEENIQVNDDDNIDDIDSKIIDEEFIEISIIDLKTMLKYETEINNFEDIELGKLNEYTKNLKKIFNIISSSLDKNNIESVECNLIKRKDKIILDIEYNDTLFTIPIKIDVLLKKESNDIIVTRRLDQLDEKKQELELVTFHIKKELNKSQRENMLFRENLQNYVNHLANIDNSFISVIKFLRNMLLMALLFYLFLVGLLIFLILFYINPHEHE